MSKKDQPRDIVYPVYRAVLKQGKSALKCEEAKKLLGWVEDTEAEPFAEGEYIPEIEIPSGRRVRCFNNLKNRLIQKSHFEALTQEHLMGRWGKGDSTSPDGIGIGKTGQIMSGQNRLASFVVACLIHQSDTEEGAHWRSIHPEPLTMDCILVTGMDESDETFRFLNTGLPATIADCIYRGDYLKKKYKQSDRAAVARSIQSCIFTLWTRTGHGNDAFSDECTNSEGMEFLQRHKRIIEAVEHIHEEYKSGEGHARRMGPGQAAALLWLFGQSATPDRTRYEKHKGDKGCDWSRWDMARDFFTALCKTDDPHSPFAILRDMLTEMTDPETPLHGTYERKVLLTKAWHLFVSGQKTWTRADLRLKWVTKTDKDGNDLGRLLNEFPSIGGVDLNEGKGFAKPPTDDADEAGDPPVTESEVQERVTEERTKKEEKSSGGDGDKPTTDVEKPGLKKQLADIRVAHPNKVLLFQSKPNTEYIVYEEDAILFERLFKWVPKNWMDDKIKFIGFKPSKYDEVIDKLKKAKKKAVLVTPDAEGQCVVTEIEMKKEAA